MSGRRLSVKEMNMVKHDDEILNSMENRGEIDRSDVVRSRHVVCGCGAEGCVFVSHTRKDKSVDAGTKSLDKTS